MKKKSEKIAKNQGTVIHTDFFPWLILIQLPINYHLHVDFRATLCKSLINVINRCKKRKTSKTREQIAKICKSGTSTNIGFSNGPGVRYRNFFIPRVEKKPPKMDPRFHSQVLRGFFSEQFYPVFIPFIEPIIFWPCFHSSSYCSKQWLPCFHSSS